MRGWDPGVYARFEAERNRPAEDLLARLPQGNRAGIVDLGCGGGTSTQLLRVKYPDSPVLGVDNSVEMLAAARKRLPDIEFVEGDAAIWRVGAADLVFANAVFHWVRDHIGAMARLVGELPAGGCLAAQMPDNENEPTHALMREIAALPEFREKLARVGETRETMGSFADYDAALAPACESLDIWRTTYVHRLEGPDAIVAWVEGAGLRPFLTPLADDERSHFLQLYRAAIAKAYPSRIGGHVLLPFPRLFIVARKAVATDHG